MNTQFPRWIAIAAIALMIAAAGFAQTTPPPPQTPPLAPEGQPKTPAPDPKLALTLGGFYEFNGYTQNNFFLGKDAPGLVTDHDAYMIQLFRIQPELSYGPNLKGVVRIDIAQSIFGLDNEQRDNDRPGFSNLFNNKETNFLMHVDWAYVEFSPEQIAGTTFRVGRMGNKLGNLLVLDQDGDGVQVSRKYGNWVTTFDWTKMYEGADSLTDDVAPGGVSGEDSDLFYVNFAGKRGNFNLNPFIAYYRDRGDIDGRTYAPNELQYFNARFRPNLSQVTALGFAFAGKAGKVALKGEVDYLTGSDDVPNVNSGPNQLLDVNNGDLTGYNLYLDAKMPVGKATVGAVFGMGSGDDDPMSGDGNINKIRTNGFFYVNEVWEDSIMPDEEGITPQGLGSPGSRGYREFENTTLLQLNASFPIRPQWKLFLSGTVMKATEPLRPWSDVNGNGAIDPGEFGAASSDDLGSEVDFMLDWNVMKNLIWTLRGGVFFPGDAAGYLINGTALYDDSAWELRTTLRFNYGGLKIGG
ncbi:MAG: hypothetical protein ABR517_06920 [Thermoanaerobaculia bacterium]